MLVVSHTGGERARAICTSLNIFTISSKLLIFIPKNIVKGGVASFHVAKMECLVEWRLALVSSPDCYTAARRR